MSLVNIPKTNDDPFMRYKRQIVILQMVKGYTVITNLSEISHSLGRPMSDIISYIGKSLGTNVSQNRLRGTIFTIKQIEDILECYIEKHVLCSICQNPETEILKNKRRCKACGNICV